MNPLFILRLAVLNTFKKRLRVSLAILGIALTSSVIVSLFGIQLGLRDLIDSEIKNGQSLDVITVNNRDVQEVRLDQERVSEIQSISGVTEIAESAGLYGTVTYHGISLNAPVYAVSSSYFSMSPSNITTGSTEGEPRANSLIMSEKALEVFGIERSSAVGKMVNISSILPKKYASNQATEEVTTPDKEYKIEGVVSRGDLPVFYVDIEQMKELGLNSVTQLNVRVTTPDKVPEVRETIERLGLQTSSVQDTIGQINQLFDVIQNILIVFGFIVFAITVSSAFTVITLTLMEETKQIGFLRIMGLRHTDVMRLFIIQSILVTTLGALLGCIGGIAVGSVLNGYANILAQDSTFNGDISIFIIPGIQVILILTLSVVVGWLVGILPARRAIRINPLKELLL